MKWGCPCYTFEKKNIVLIHDFKEYCALLFFKGALLKDPNGILIQQTENVQAARQARFTNVNEINKAKAAIKAYIFEAIEVEKAGLKVPLKKNKRICYSRRISKEIKQNFGSQGGIQIINTGTSAGIYPLLFICKTGGHPRSQN